MTVQRAAFVRALGARAADDVAFLLTANDARDHELADLFRRRAIEIAQSDPQRGVAALSGMATLTVRLLEAGDRPADEVVREFRQELIDEAEATAAFLERQE